MVKEYKGYKINQNGEVKRNGKIVKSDKLYIDKQFVSVDSLIEQLFNTDSKPLECEYKYTPKLTNGNRGKLKSKQTKERMRLAKAKKIVFEGIEYNSIKECADTLGVNRSTIYRRLYQQQERE